MRIVQVSDNFLGLTIGVYLTWKAHSHSINTTDVENMYIHPKIEKYECISESINDFLHQTYRYSNVSSTNDDINSNTLSFLCFLMFIQFKKKIPVFIVFTLRHRILSYLLPFQNDLGLIRIFSWLLRTP